MKNFNISLDHWVLLDENYADFLKNEIREFALNVRLKRVKKSDTNLRTIKCTQSSDYLGNGLVVFKDDNILVIDFGILAYSDDRYIAGIEIGDYLSGVFELRVDSYDYFEVLFKIEGILPLIYTWKVKKIFYETSPMFNISPDKNMIETLAPGTIYSSQEIDSTSVSCIEPVQPHFILCCTLLPPSPKFKFSV